MSRENSFLHHAATAQSGIGTAYGVVRAFFFAELVELDPAGSGFASKPVSLLWLLPLLKQEASLKRKENGEGREHNHHDSSVVSSLV